MTETEMFLRGQRQSCTSSQGLEGKIQPRDEFLVLKKNFETPKESVKTEEDDDDDERLSSSSSEVQTARLIDFDSGESEPLNWAHLTSEASMISLGLKGQYFYESSESLSFYENILNEKSSKDELFGDEEEYLSYSSSFFESKCFPGSFKGVALERPSSPPTNSQPYQRPIKSTPTTNLTPIRQISIVAPMKRREINISRCNEKSSSEIPKDDGKNKDMSRVKLPNYHLASFSVREKTLGFSSSFSESKNLTNKHSKPSSRHTDPKSAHSNPKSAHSNPKSAHSNPKTSHPNPKTPHPNPKIPHPNPMTTPNIQKQPMCKGRKPSLFSTSSTSSSSSCFSSSILSSSVSFSSTSYKSKLPSIPSHFVSSSVSKKNSTTSLGRSQSTLTPSQKPKILPRRRESFAFSAPRPKLTSTPRDDCDRIALPSPLGELRTKK